MAHTPDDAQSLSNEPRGFSEHTRRSSSEHAHEQGWGLNEEQRRQIPPAQQQSGGTDYEYGAQDFGDVPSDTSAAEQPDRARPKSMQPESRNVNEEAVRKPFGRRKSA